MHEARSLGAHQRLTQIVADVNPVPIITDPPVEQMGLERQLDRDSQEVAGDFGVAVESRLGGLVEACRVAPEGFRQWAIGAIAPLWNPAVHVRASRPVRSRTARAISP